ncbi:hypothetical protein [Ehrlichia muris]|uniref:hypothetical protein n=1 Tax=Ehrlichia muris TaxID=35795 RepID=UPI0037C0BED6
MLIGKFKWDAFINYEKSYLASFLRNLGFSDVDILALLCIIASFHQNTASYIVDSVGVYSEIIVHSNSHVEFTPHAPDHRSYAFYHDILQKLDSGVILDLASKGSLWTTQMYGLFHICTCAIRYILSGECSTDEEIVEKLMNDIQKVSVCVMSYGEKHQYSIDKADNDELLRYSQRFSSLVLGEDHLTLPNMLASLVSYIRSQYSLSVQDLRETCNRDVLAKIMALVIYKTAIHQFVSINSNELSNTCKSQIFPMIAPFVCNYTSTLPLSCRSHLGIVEDLVLLGFYRNLFSVFHDCKIDEYYESEYMLTTAVASDMFASIRKSLDSVLDTSVEYYPYYSFTTTFVIYDVMLACNEVLRDRNLEAVVLFERVIMLYKLKECEVENKICYTLFDTRLQEFKFSYIDGHQKKYGLELLLELLFTCYHAAFLGEQTVNNVKMFYDKCYNKLSAIAGSASGYSYNNIVLSYKEYKKELEGLYGYKQVGFLDIKYDTRLLFILIQHLLFNEINVEQATKSNLTYNVFIECKPVNEVKAQQAAMMLCQAFKKSNGVIDDCSVKGVTGLLMVVLFGNFLQRNIVLRLFDIFHIAYRKCEECGIHEEKDMAENLTGYCSVILNLLKGIDNKLPFSFSMEEVWGLDSDSAAVYGQLMFMVNCYASGLGISLSDLEQERNTVYDSGFSKILCGIPISSAKQSDPSMQVNPCSSFDRAQCLLSIQLMSSYVCLYNPDKIDNDLFSGDLSLPSFLLGSILTYPPLFGDFVKLCHEYTLMKGYPVEKKFSEILMSLCNEEELPRISDWEVISDVDAERSHGITQNIIMNLIKEDGSSNLNETIFKDACLSIIKLRELKHDGVARNIESACHSSAMSCHIVDDELSAKVLSSEDTTKVIETSDNVHHLVPIQAADLDVKCDGNNNQYENVSKECDFKTKKVLPDDNVETRQGGLIMDDKTVIDQKNVVVLPHPSLQPIVDGTVDTKVGVDQKPEDIVAQGANLQPSINEIKEPESHGRPDARVCDLDNEQKIQALQKKICCLIVAAVTMISTFVILMCVAFTCPMSRGLFAGCIVGAITCLTLSIIGCFSICVRSTDALSTMSHDGHDDENDICPQPILNSSIAEMQDPNYIG